MGHSKTRGLVCWPLVRNSGCNLKIFVIGGIVREGPVDAAAQRGILNLSMGSIGRQIAEARHDLMVCSPYEGSADVDALRGWASVAVSEEPSRQTSVELHYPDDVDIAANILALQKELGLEGMQMFRHPVSRRSDGSLDRANSWLLAQLAALDRCHVVVAIGGNPGGASNLLLQLATTRRCPVFPLAYLGGGAAIFLERYRYELFARLGDEFGDIQKIEKVDAVLPMIEALAEQSSAKFKQSERPRFFISYARGRPEEADYVEMTLRRRNCDVFRDEHDFEAGKPILSEISEKIFSADIFIALWCKEYACSPWCYDELEQALDRHQSGSLRVVLLSLDQTRIISPRARPLIGYTCYTRVELETRVRAVIDMAEGL